jgi:hypothetical protein
MFGFEELKKGYFPHLFNMKENQSVVLNHLPDVHYYNPNAMKLMDRKAFFMCFLHDVSLSWNDTDGIGS